MAPLTRRKQEKQRKNTWSNRQHRGEKLAWKKPKTTKQLKSQKQSDLKTRREAMAKRRMALKCNPLKYEEYKAKDRLRHAAAVNTR
ncbi:Hypothetical predicted protein, partial [Olea europaea subsp. europaea]